ncbi:MAG: purine-nucleoside phosphorylase [Ruminococcaceae bacterium]|nr:purine-nucleoside phosphorylase [Oscillospiraceae bacterium]
MTKPYPTPHIHAEPKQIAKTVLMPGDPLRAEFVAKTFLKDAVLFNNVRGVQGYTGTWNGVPVSVMASGMGMPSIGIYSYELYHFFAVENIIRIGSAGALTEKVGLRELVLGMGACTNSAYGSQFGLRGSYAPIADFSLLETAVDLAKEKGLSYHVGNLLSSDTFYDDDAEATLRWANMGVLAVEMEAAALYMNAARAGKRALAICTVSDSLVTGEATTAQERQESFTDMMTLALELAAKQGRRDNGQI